MHTFQIPLLDKRENSRNSGCSRLYVSVGPGLGFHQFSCFFQPWKPSLQKEGITDGLMKSELNIVSHYGGQAVVKPLWEKSCIHTFQFLSTLKELGTPWNPAFYLDFLLHGRAHLVS